MEKLNQPFVFQSDSTVVKEAYNDKDNFLIEYDCSQNNTYCAIYFSSNNIYYPNTEESFKSSILEKNRYEWYGTRIPYAYKHIFIRDIQKQWYLTGVNGKISTPEQLLSFLQNETKNFKIITVGSSAGGFAAVLYGSWLRAQLILSFNGQFEIKSLLKNSTESIDPVVFRVCENKELCDFFDVKPFITDASNIFYFHSKGSPYDSEQKDYVKDVELNVIEFKTKHHGVPFLKCNLPVILSKSHNELKTLSANTYNPLCFSIQVVGLKETLLGLISQILKRYIFK